MVKERTYPDIPESVVSKAFGLDGQSLEMNSNSIKMEFD